MVVYLSAHCSLFHPSHDWGKVLSIVLGFVHFKEGGICCPLCDRKGMEEYMTSLGLFVLELTCYLIWLSMQFCLCVMLGLLRYAIT